jgi:hypothetical protein
MPFREIEKRKAYQQNYREAHKEKIKAYQQAYRKSHKKELADYKAEHENRIDIICIQCGKQTTARARNSGRFCSYNCFQKWQSGKNHPMYGKHHTPEAREKMSNAHRGPRPNRVGKHHSLATRIKLSDAAACCDGKPVRFAALCHSCHSKTNHERARWEYMLHRAIDEIWDGKSYFTKEEYARFEFGESG